MKEITSFNGVNRPDKALSVKDSLHIAINCFQQGNLEDSKYFFNEILSINPNHSEAWFYIALIADHEGLHNYAIGCLNNALSSDPHNLKYLYTLGDIYHTQNNFDEGVKLFEYIIKINPKDSNGYYNLGVLLQKQTKFAKALSCYQKVLEFDEKNINALYNMGNILIDFKEFGNAVQYFERVIQEQPNSDDSLTNLGFLYLELGDFDRAIAYLNKAILINPDNYIALNNLGKVHEKKCSYFDSLIYFDKAVKLNPEFAEAYSNRGAVLNELKQFDTALSDFDKAIYLKSDASEAYLNRGNTFREMNRFEEALASYEKAILLNPNYFESYCNRGFIFNDFKLFEQALTNYEIAISLNPSYAEAYINKSFCLLLTGNFIQGWDLYEWRWKVEKLGLLKPIFIQPLWLGSENLAGKTILLHAEQGLGDTIQFCRYAKLVQELGARVLLQVPKALMGLLKGLEGVDQLFAKGSELPEFDYQCPLMSLPLALKTTVETIPAPIPYILSDLGLQNKWRQHLGDEGFKVAICWQGSTKGKVDVGRSFPVGLFEGLSKIDGVRLISLQKNEGVEQLKNLPEGMRVETLPDNFDSGDNSFLDSAALMKCVDLVITSDTALTHLAGALGVKTWLPLKYVPDWRWMLDRSDSPWYPNHRLFRQTIRDDWASVFKEIEYELKSLVNST